MAKENRKLEKNKPPEGIKPYTKSIEHIEEAIDINKKIIVEAKLDPTTRTEVEVMLQSLLFLKGYAYLQRGRVYGLLKKNTNKALEDFTNALKYDKSLMASFPELHIVEKIEALDEKTRKKFFPLLYDFLKKVLEIRGKSMPETSQAKKPKDPQYYSHYTSLDVIHKMFAKPVMRMYQTTYMNDPEEGKALFDLLPELKKFYTKKDGGDVTNTKAENYHGYLASFVPERQIKNEDEDGNALRSWREYGHDAKGVKLVIPLNKFKGGIRDTMPSSRKQSKEIDFFIKKEDLPSSLPSSIYKVRYVKSQENDKKGFEEQKKGFSKLKKILGKIETLKKVIYPKNKTQRDLINEVVRFVADHLRLLYKSFFYRYEEEYRMFVAIPEQKPNMSASVEIDPEQRKFFTSIGDADFLFGEGTKVYIGAAARDQEKERIAIEYFKENEYDEESKQSKPRKAPYQYDVKLSKIKYRA